MNGMETERVPVAQAAREIGCCEQFLRQQMKCGEWDLGQVKKPPRGGNRYTYYVFRSKLDKFLGKPIVIPQ